MTVSGPAYSKYLLSFFWKLFYTRHQSLLVGLSDSDSHHMIFYKPIVPFLISLLEVIDMFDRLDVFFGGFHTFILCWEYATFLIGNINFQLWISLDLRDKRLINLQISELWNLILIYFYIHIYSRFVVLFVWQNFTSSVMSRLEKLIKYRDKMVLL